MSDQDFLLPTMIEAESLEQLVEIQVAYLKAKENGSLLVNTDFIVLRSKENDLLAYFHDANKKPSIKETVEWMQDSRNLSFPGHVSLKQGIKDRYDENFHDELDRVIPEVFDAYLARSKQLSELVDIPEIMELIEKISATLPPVKKVTIK